MQRAAVATFLVLMALFIVASNKQGVRDGSLGIAVQQSGFQDEGLAVPDTQVLIMRHENHTNTGHPEWEAAGDSITHLVGSSYMIWDDLNSNDVDDSTDYSSTFARCAFFNQSSGWPKTPPHYVTMMWFDLDQLPSGCKIIEAKLCLQYDSTRASRTGVTNYAILDTFSQDAEWLNGGWWGTGTTFSKHATWSEAIEGTEAWASVDGSTALNDRTEWIHWGIRSDTAGPTDFDGGDDFDYDVTTAVQLYVDGYCAANAGWMIYAAKAGSEGDLFMSCKRPDWSPADTQPFLKVTYVSNRSYNQPWGSSPLAVVLCTDDGYDVCLDFADTMEAYSENMTFFLVEKWIGGGGYLTYPQVRHLRDTDHEIAAHSVNHRNPGGVLGPDDPDSISLECDPIWLENEVLQAVTSFALPRHVHSLISDSVLVAKGYLGARDGLEGVVAGYDAGATWEVPYPPDNGRVGEATRRLSWTDTTNIYKIAATTTIDSITGGDGASPTQTSMFWKFNELCTRKAMAGGNELILLYWHDERDGGTYDGGITPTELGLLVSALQGTGLYNFMTMTEALTEYRGAHMAVDAPSWAADADSAGVTSGNGIYWAPIDATGPPVADGTPLTNPTMRYAAIDGQEDGNYDLDDDDVWDTWTNRLANTAVESLATLDALIIPGNNLWQQSAGSYELFDSLAIRLKAANPNIQIYGYLQSKVIRNTWSTADAGSFERTMYDTLIAYAAEDSLGSSPLSDGYGTHKWLDVTMPACRAAWAQVFFDLWDASQAGDYTDGVVIDHRTVPIQLWEVYETGGDYFFPDFDEDGDSYYTDQDDKDAYELHHQQLTTAIRALYMQGLPRSFYVIWNGLDAYHEDATEFMSLIDGVWLEKLPVWWESGQSHYGDAWMNAIWNGADYGCLPMLDISQYVGVGRWDQSYRGDPVIFYEHFGAAPLDDEMEICMLMDDNGYAVRTDNGSRHFQTPQNPKLESLLGEPLIPTQLYPASNMFFRSFEGGFLWGQIDSTKSHQDTAFKYVAVSLGVEPDTFRVNWPPSDPPEPPPEPLPAPDIGNLAMYSAGDTNTVWWAAVDKADRYMVYCDEEIACETPVDSAWTVDLSYQFTGLTEQKHYYRVRGESTYYPYALWSDVDSTTQDETPPTLTFNATPTTSDVDSDINVTFDVTSDDEHDIGSRVQAQHKMTIAAAWPDTSAGSWENMSVEHDFTYDSNETVPNEAATGPKTWAWTPPDTGTPEEYQLQHRINYLLDSSAWATVEFITGSPPNTQITYNQPRGIVEARVRAINATQADTSNWSTVSSEYEIASDMIYTRLASSDIVANADFSSQYNLIYTVPDVTAPDTSYMASVALDTGIVSNMRLVIKVGPDEPAYGQFQWKQSSWGNSWQDDQDGENGDWLSSRGDSSYVNFAANETIHYYLHTGLATSSLPLDLWVQFKLKDDEWYVDQNESSWFNSEADYKFYRNFTRAAGGPDVTPPVAQAPIFAKDMDDTSSGSYYIHVASGADEPSYGWWTYAETGQSFMYADSTEGHGYGPDSTGTGAFVTSVSDTFMLPVDDWGDKRVTWKFQLRDDEAPPNVATAIDSTTQSTLSLWLARAAEAPPTPSISGITAAPWEDGMAVTVTGSDFGSSQGTGTVHISDNNTGPTAGDYQEQTSIGAWADASITFTLDDHASWTEENVYPYVQHDNDNWSTEQASYARAFNIPGSVNISSVTPSDRQIADDETTTLGGTEFGNYDLGAAKVEIDATGTFPSPTEQSVDTWSDTSIEFDMDYGSEGFDDDDDIHIRVTNAEADDDTVRASAEVGGTQYLYVFSHHTEAFGDSANADYWVTDGCGHARMRRGGSTTSVDLGNYSGIVSPEPEGMPMNDTSSYDAVGLLCYNVDDNLSGATVDSAKLHIFFYDGAGNNGDFTGTGEFISATVCTTAAAAVWVGYAATAEADCEACYAYSHGTTAWTTMWGTYNDVGDFGYDIQMQVDLSSGTQEVIFTGDDLKNGIQYWIDNANSEGGFFMFGESLDSSGEFMHFYSHHTSAEHYRPYLEVWTTE